MATLDKGIRKIIESLPQVKRGGRVLLIAPRAQAFVGGIVPPLAALGLTAEAVVAEVSAADRWRKNNPNGLNVRVMAVQDLADEVAGVYEVVIIAPHKDKELTNAYARVAVRLLRMGGSLISVGGKDEGVESLNKYIAELGMTPHQGIIMKPTGRAQLWVKPLELRLGKIEVPRYGFVASWGDTQLQVVTLPGVFAKNHFDEGTQALLQVLKVNPGERMLDLACGPGTLGLLALKRDPSLRLSLADDDANAIAAVGLTVAANRLPTPEMIYLGDGLNGLNRRILDYDVIVLNPPFHTGQSISYAIAEQLANGAAAHLKKEGRLYLVANKACPYEKFLKTIFTQVNVIHTDKNYKVWQCGKM